jgi:hypothetical protein
LPSFSSPCDLNLSSLTLQPHQYFPQLNIRDRRLNLPTLNELNELELQSIGEIRLDHLKIGQPLSRFLRQYTPKYSLFLRFQLLLRLRSLLLLVNPLLHLEHSASTYLVKLLLFYLVFAQLASSSVSWIFLEFRLSLLQLLLDFSRQLVKSPPTFARNYPSFTLSFLNEPCCFKLLQYLSNVASTTFPHMLPHSTFAVTPTVFST